MMKTFTIILIGLSLGAVGQVPKDSSYNRQQEFDKIRDRFPEAKIAAVELPEGVKQELDVVYLTILGTKYGDRELHADIFRPADERTYPAVIMVHGGGWKSGDKNLQWAIAQRLASRGFVTICVEYQMLLEALYPAAVYNLKAAIRWTRAHADEYGIDRDRIAISGSSAGGQLALLVGLTTGVKGKEGNLGDFSYTSDIQAVIDMDGVVNFLGTYSLNRTRTPETVDAIWLGGYFHEKPETWKDASSLYWANENSPPVMILKSGYPRFTTGHYELLGLLSSWGIYNEVHQFDVEVHPFWLFDPWVDPTVGYMEAFLRKAFEGG